MTAPPRDLHTTTEAAADAYDRAMFEPVELTRDLTWEPGDEQ